MRKPVTLLKPEDFANHPVWQFLPSDFPEPQMESVAVPVTSLANRVVGTPIVLANGTEVFATLSNLDCDHRDPDAIFILVSIWNGGSWIHLPRPCDATDMEAELQVAATQLGLALSDIYPLQFDVRSLVGNDRPGLVRSLPLPVATTLEADQLVAMALDLAE